MAKGIGLVGNLAYWGVSGLFIGYCCNFKVNRGLRLGDDCAEGEHAGDRRGPRMEFSLVFLIEFFSR